MTNCQSDKTTKILSCKFNFETGFIFDPNVIFARSNEVNKGQVHFRRSSVKDGKWKVEKMPD